MSLVKNNSILIFVLSLFSTTTSAFVNNDHVLSASTARCLIASTSSYSAVHGLNININANHHHHDEFRGGMRTTTTLLYGNNDNNKKNFVDEILDALDTMAGVSPLLEADLKGDVGSNSDGGSKDLIQKAKQREQQAPPDDALSKKSVIVFFALLGLIPNLFFFAAVMSGFKPFGL